MSEGFFDVLLFHARQHGGRQEQCQTPLFPADNLIIIHPDWGKSFKASSFLICFSQSLANYMSNESKQLGCWITAIYSNYWCLPAHTHMQSTHSIYFRETFWDCLVLMVKIYIWSAARWRAVSYFSSDPNLSNTTSLQLWRSQTEQEELMIPTSKTAAACLWSHYGVHLNVEVFKCDCISPQKLHGILWNKSDAEKALHLVWPWPLCHLKRQEATPSDISFC